MPKFVNPPMINPPKPHHYLTDHLTHCKYILKSCPTEYFPPPYIRKNNVSSPHITFPCSKEGASAWHGWINSAFFIEFYRILNFTDNWILWKTEFYGKPFLQVSFLHGIVFTWYHFWMYLHLRIIPYRPRLEKISTTSYWIYKDKDFKHRFGAGINAEVQAERYLTAHKQEGVF